MRVWLTQDRVRWLEIFTSCGTISFSRKILLNEAEPGARLLRQFFKKSNTSNWGDTSVEWHYCSSFPSHAHSRDSIVFVPYSIQLFGSVPEGPYIDSRDRFLPRFVGNITITLHASRISFSLPWPTCGQITLTENIHSPNLPPTSS